MKYSNPSTKNKERVFLLLLFISIVFSLYLDAEQKIKTIIIDNYQPYIFLKSRGSPDGFSVEIFQAVSQSMDLNLDISVNSWATAMRELEGGTIDSLFRS